MYINKKSVQMTYVFYAILVFAKNLKYKFIPLHLTKWAVAHESLCSNNKNSQLQCTMFCLSYK